MSTTQLPDLGARRRAEHPALAALRGARPRQWLKNGLVLAAPLGAGRLFEGDVLVATLAAFVAFCLVSSAVYLANDARDVEEDRCHPTKRHRPVACGALTVPAAWTTAAVLCVAGLLLGVTTAPALGVTLVVYLALQIGYSFGLKRQAVLDLALVSSGFLLRAIAGGVATGIAISAWFLLVASFGSLFVVAGKRYSELRQLGKHSASRPTLEHYSDSYLRFVWSLAAGLTITTYALWAYQHDLGTESSGALVSIAPFVLGVLRYAHTIDDEGAGAPEDVIGSDRVLQLVGLVWLTCVVIAVTPA